MANILVIITVHIYCYDNFLITQSYNNIINTSSAENYPHGVKSVRG